MDKIAKVVGLSPEELRRRNFLATGDCTATGQSLTDPVDMQALLTRALEEHGYHEKLRRFKEENKGSSIKRGVGFATFMHGAGFTGSGERRLNSLVHVDITEDGRPKILVSSTEFGQGTSTILCQVAAQALSLPYEEILIAQPDTSVVPNSGPTVASRTAMVVGKLGGACLHTIIGNPFGIIAICPLTTLRISSAKLHVLTLRGMAPCELPSDMNP